MRKKLISVLICLFFFAPIINAQTPWEELPSNLHPLACNPNTNTCNYIRNNNFALSCADPTYFYNAEQPFINCVAYWSYTHGTAQISKWGSLYAPGVNHASMRANFGPHPITGEPWSTSEGIAVGVKRMTSGSTFKLSFKKRYYSPNNAGYTTDLDNYYVVLLTCSAYYSIKALEETYVIPQIPATGAQVVYVESNTSNTNWQTVEQYFTSNGAYDVIWIYPKNNTGPNTEAWLELAQPELMKVGTCGVDNPVPAITTNSHFEYFCDPKPANSAIIPYTLNQSICLFWECWDIANFYSNMGNSNDQWYVNDVLITATGSGPQGSYIHNFTNGHLAISGANKNLKIQLKNSTFGYQQLTIPTYVYTANRFHSSDFNFKYKPSYTTTFSTPGDWLSGPNATYTWSIPGVNLVDASNLTPQVQATFPAGISLGGLTGTLTVSNSDCNDVYNVTLTYDANLRMALPGSTSEVKNLISVYPNPATNLVTINSSFDKIQSIEITALTGFQRKKIPIQNINTTVINISDLKPGIYNCNILTDKGSYTEKLLIKR